MTGTMKLYVESKSVRTAARMAAMTGAEKELADSIYKLAGDNYSNGGDVIVECWEPWALVAEFKTLDDAREYMGLVHDRAEDIRNA